MKNISLNINPNAITSLPPPAYPAAPPFVSAKQTYSISFSIQFENEAECLSFANKLLNMANGDAE